MVPPVAPRDEEAATPEVPTPDVRVLGVVEKTKVLVVDDDPGVRESTSEILRAEGFDVTVAGDGAAATWLLAGEEFDVVILDLSLCHVDGTAVLEALEPPASVVIVSAFSAVDESTLRDEFQGTIFDCLRKPVPPARLIEVVGAAAARRQRTGRGTLVKPIDERDALRLAFAGLARLRPQPHGA